MNTLNEEQQRQLLHDGIEILCKIIGKDNIRSVAIHYDEQGPHVHIFWEPMTEDGRLCAKEKHNLKFFNQLNVDVPKFMRSRGWDIDDCNVYDEALYNLMTEEEKAQRRHKNGKNSVVYKADAEKALNEINRQIETNLTTFEHNITHALQDTLTAVANDESGVYDNVIYLMYACDDKRFAELNEEGYRLKVAALQDYTENNDIPRTTLSLTEQIKRATVPEISWQERQQLWESYREISEDFWYIRNELKQSNDALLNDVYSERAKAKKSYYDAMYFLHTSRGWIALFASLIMICSATAKEKAADKKIQQLKKERQKLIANTASFKKYSNAYRDTLKAGQRPLEDYLRSMEEIATILDQEVDRTKSKPSIIYSELTKQILTP